MSKGHFLWPEASRRAILAGLAKPVAVDYVENLFAQLFPSGHPVLCSSARAALVLALRYLEVSRSNFVGVFPFASHCVLDAVSRCATPLCSALHADNDLIARVIYHQWGFVQNQPAKVNTIEDAVDTLCVPNTQLFPSGGMFELWSLPKILGTSSGGILWCKDPDTAKEVRKMRGEQGGGCLVYTLRLLGTKHHAARLLWQGIEPSAGNLSRWQAGEILTAVKQLDKIVSDRREKLDFMLPLLVGWLEKPKDRLPPVVPAQIKWSGENLNRYGLRAGYRHFEHIGSDLSRSLIRVLPIPIHQCVSMSWLHSVKDALCR